MASPSRILILLIMVHPLQAWTNIQAVGQVRTHTESKRDPNILQTVVVWRESVNRFQVVAGRRRTLQAQRLRRTQHVLFLTRVSSRIVASTIAAEVRRRKCFSPRNPPSYVGGYHSSPHSGFLMNRTLLH